MSHPCKMKESHFYQRGNLFPYSTGCQGMATIEGLSSPSRGTVPSSLPNTFMPSSSIPRNDSSTTGAPLQYQNSLHVKSDLKSDLGKRISCNFKDRNIFVRYTNIFNEIVICNTADYYPRSLLLPSQKYCTLII